MSKPGRVWFPLDANFIRDPAIQRAGERAGWLFVGVLGQLKLTGAPGLISVLEVASLGITHAQPRLDALLEAELLAPTDDPGVLWVPSWEGWSRSNRAEYMREYRRRNPSPNGVTER